MWGPPGNPLRISAAAARSDFTDPHSPPRPVPTSSSISTRPLPRHHQRVQAGLHKGRFHLACRRSSDFGADGALYVSVGDGTSFDYADPRQPTCSRSIVSGKILRIDPATGLGLADNPFVTSGVSLDSNRAKVFQLGLAQSVFRHVRTGWPSVHRRHRMELLGGDRQRRPWREFRLAVFRGRRWRRNLKTPTYSACRPPPRSTSVAAGTIIVTAPFRAFSHNSADPGFQDQAITAGEAIYTGNIYPSSLQNNFFFTNFPTGQIFAVNINNSADAKFLYSVAGSAPTDFDGDCRVASLLAMTGKPEKSRADFRIRTAAPSSACRGCPSRRSPSASRGNPPPASRTDRPARARGCCASR